MNSRRYKGAIFYKKPIITAKDFAVWKIRKCREKSMAQCQAERALFQCQPTKTALLAGDSLANEKNKSHNLLVPESRDKGAILAAVLVFPGKHGQSQVTPLVRSQTLHRHQNPVTLAAVVAPRPGFIFQGCSIFSFCKFQNARVFGSLKTLHQSCV